LDLPSKNGDFPLFSHQFSVHRTSLEGRPGAAESGDADLGRGIRLARSLAALAGKPKAAPKRSHGWLRTSTIVKIDP